MVRRENEIKVREANQVQGGKGTIFFRDWIVTSEEAKGHGRVISQVVLPVGTSIGYHKHVGEFEAYIVIAGKALVNDNGTEIVLNPGDMHLCKDGDAHSVESIGEETLVLDAVILNTLA